MNGENIQIRMLLRVWVNTSNLKKCEKKIVYVLYHSGYVYICTNNLIISNIQRKELITVKFSPDNFF